jgi:hypothetical protein
MPLRANQYKDKEKLRITRNAQRKRYYNKTTNIYKRRKWTTEDIQLILNSNLTDMELSKLIERSVPSIQVKRNKIRKELEAKTA